MPLRAYLAGLVALFVIGAGAATLYGRVQAEDDARAAALADARFSARLAARQLTDGVQVLRQTVGATAANPGIAAPYRTHNCALEFGSTNGDTQGHLDLVAADGSLACSSMKSPARGYAGAPWLADALRAPLVRGPATDPRTGRQVVLASAPVPKRGLVVAMYYLDSVGRSLGTSYGGPRRLEFVIVAGRTILTRSIAPDRWIGRRLAAPLTDRDLDGRRRLYASAIVPGVGWRIYAGADRAAAVAATRDLNRRELTISVIVLLLFLAAVAIVHRRIARPLERLSAEVRAAAESGEQRPLPVAGPAEVATLARRLNELGDAVTERERLREQLQQSQRLESLGQLAGGIAHDFNNLLAVILGYAAFILRRAPAGSEDERDVTEIRKAGERATRLTHQLLAFARRETVSPKVLDLTGVVLEMEQLLRRTLGEHVRLETSLAPDLWPILADDGQLEQVLVNLAVNARDAMPDGGRLTLDTENIEVDAAYAAVRSGLEPGRYVRLRVSDTGTGMEPHVAARAFEPFFTTKAKGDGTGLGLATIYGIVTQAGGHVQLYSEPGLGTTFTILLPATNAPVPDPAAPPPPAPRGDGETVLLVEDEPAMLEVTRRLLEESGYRVLTAGAGADALALAGAHDVDLLVTDVVMPGMLGRDVAARVEALHPGIGVLYMSGYSQGVIGPQGELANGAPVIEKPFTASALLGRVRDALSAARAPSSD